MTHLEVREAKEKAERCRRTAELDETMHGGAKAHWLWQEYKVAKNNWLVMLHEYEREVPF